MRSTRSDPRNAFQGQRGWLFQGFVALVVATGVVVVLQAARALDGQALMHLGPAFVLVCGLLLIGELRPLFMAGSKDANGMVLSTAFVFALLLRYGLPVAVVMQAFATAMTDTGNNKAPWRTGFNVSQYCLSWAAASYVMDLVGHQASLAAPLSLRSHDLVAAAAGAVTFFLVNQLLVTRAVSYKLGETMWAAMRPSLGYELLSNGAMLALAPLVALAVERGVAFVPLLLPPVIAVYTVASVALDRERRALSDALTNLPNRVLLAERAAAALSARESTHVVALALFDLDRFKEVNDTLGHHVGDRLLQVVAQRLAAAVRPCDTVARLGGDEFAVLLPELPDASNAVDAVSRLRQAVTEPIVLEGLLIDVGASVGLAICPADGVDLDALLQRADVAMYLSKESGAVEQYDVGRDHNSTSRLAMLGELRLAIETDQLELHYQPKAELATGRVTGVEALVRWRHPDRGLIPPDDFIPLAERSGLIEQLTAWVLDSALAQVAAWRDQGLLLQVAVNVSVKDLSGFVLTDRVAACLTAYDVPAHLLQLEVTEGSLMAEPVRAGAELGRLAALGVSLSLDDFGTGWSSLGHLRQLPVQELKIDRSFVQRMGDGARDVAIVRSVVDLARGLGMSVVAEGVEDERTWVALREVGCDVAQGWWLARALPADELVTWLAERDATTRDGLLALP